jgi:hypothetical protein
MKLYDAGSWKPEISLSEQRAIIKKQLAEQGYDFDALWQAGDTKALEQLLPAGQWREFHQKWQSATQKANNYFAKVDPKSFSIEIQSMLNNTLLVAAANKLRERDCYTEIPPIIPARGCTSEQLTLLCKARTAFLPAQPYIDKGKKFKPGRQKGFISIRNQYIHTLAIQNPEKTAKELRLMADPDIIKDMADVTFYKEVSKGKNPK